MWESGNWLQQTRKWVESLPSKGDKPWEPTKGHHREVGGNGEKPDDKTWSSMAYKTIPMNPLLVYIKKLVIKEGFKR